MNAETDRSESTTMNRETPQISIVVPVYNAVPYLEETVCSLLAQTFSDFEVLLVDDHSNDGSLALAERLAEADPRISAFQVGQRCGGPAGPRNAGVAAARGKWIAFCDADDLWMPDKLALQMQLLRECNAAMCSSEATRFFRDLELLGSGIEGVPPWRKVSFWANRLKNEVVASSVLVRRDLLRKYSFNSDPRYRAVEDYDCWLRIIEEVGFCVKIKIPLVGYRIRESQISGNKLKQIVRVFGVHWRYGRSFSKLNAFVFAASHALGAACQRALGISV